MKFRTFLVKMVTGALLAVTIITSNGCAQEVNEPIQIQSEEIEEIFKQQGALNIKLVNKDNEITQEEIDQIKLEKTTDVDGNTVYLEENTLKAFTKLQAALKEKGYTIGINTGFRNLEDQQDIYDEIKAEQGQAYADQYVAPVGHSEHHTGRAIDVNIGRAAIFGKDIPLQINREYQKTKKELYAIMADYGFILRYPAGKEEITGYPEEAWHITYVGTEAARFITDKNLTLEEYCAIMDQYQEQYAEQSIEFDEMT